MNLVSNAVHCTTRGGVLVGSRQRGGRLRIDIFDTGSGIPQEQQQSIFQEYYQLAAVKSRRGSGLGLGLAIVDRLGRLLGHEVELSHARPRLALLRDAAAGKRAGRRRKRRRRFAGAVDPAIGKLVVVIDDDLLVLEGMDGILRAWGCEVVAGTSEAEALVKVAALLRRPDLIISDYRLDGRHTGIEALGDLRANLYAGCPLPS